MKEPFEKVVAAHGARVLRVCRAVLGVHTDADDAWSETFLGLPYEAVAELLGGTAAAARRAAADGVKHLRAGYGSSPADAKGESQ